MNGLAIDCELRNHYRPIELLYAIVLLTKIFHKGPDATIARHFPRGERIDREADNICVGPTWVIARNSAFACWRPNVIGLVGPGAASIDEMPIGCTVIPCLRLGPRISFDPGIHFVSPAYENR